jgi:hypothetical protein
MSAKHLYNYGASSMRCIFAALSREKVLGVRSALAVLALKRGNIELAATAVVVHVPDFAEYWALGPAHVVDACTIARHHRMLPSHVTFLTITRHHHMSPLHTEHRPAKAHVTVGVSAIQGKPGEGVEAERGQGRRKQKGILVMKCRNLSLSLIP